MEPIVLYGLQARSSWSGRLATYLGFSVRYRFLFRLEIIDKIKILSTVPNDIRRHWSENLKIGAHISAAGGVDKVFDRANSIGAEVVQIFVSSPRGWTFKPLAFETICSFQQQFSTSIVEQVFFHGIYLVSVGTDNKENLDKGEESLKNYMQTARDFGAYGVIFHAGSHKGVGFEAVFNQAVQTNGKVLDQSPKDTCLILENSA